MREQQIIRLRVMLSCCSDVGRIILLILLVLVVIGHWDAVAAAGPAVLAWLTDGGKVFWPWIAVLLAASAGLVWAICVGGKAAVLKDDALDTFSMWFAGASLLAAFLASASCWYGSPALDGQSTGAQVVEVVSLGWAAVLSVCAVVVGVAGLGAGICWWLRVGDGKSADSESTVAK